MKKLYSFILALGLCTAASAQDFTLTVDDVNVDDKSTYTQVYNVDAFDKIPGMPQVGQKYGLYPKIMLTSQVDQDVIVTLRDVTHDPGTQFCYGTTCDELYKMDYQSTKTAALKAGKATDLSIHVQHDSAGDAPYEVALKIDAYGTVNTKSYSCDIILKYDPNATGLTATLQSDNAPYYTLSGVKVAAPSSGLYIRNGRKVLVK